MESCAPQTSSCWSVVSVSRLETRARFFISHYIVSPPFSDRGFLFDPGGSRSSIPSAAKTRRASRFGPAAMTCCLPLRSRIVNPQGLHRLKSLLGAEGKRSTVEELPQDPQQEEGELSDEQVRTDPFVPLVPDRAPLDQVLEAPGSSLRGRRAPCSATPLLVHQGSEIGREDVSPLMKGLGLELRQGRGRRSSGSPCLAGAPGPHERRSWRASSAARLNHLLDLFQVLLGPGHGTLSHSRLISLRSSLSAMKTRTPSRPLFTSWTRVPLPQRRAPPGATRATVLLASPSLAFHARISS